MIINKLKETIKLQDIIKIDKVHYKSKRKKTHNSSEYSLPIVFLRDMQGEYLSLKDADDEQSKFANTLNNIDILNNFKNRLFSIKNLEPESEPELEPEPKPKYRKLLKTYITI